MKFHFVKTSISVAIAIIMVGFNVIIPNLSLAQSSRASEIDRSATQALTTLYKNRPGAKALGDKAVAVLIFPSIVKGGFIIAGQFGDGALRKGGKTVAYYRSLAASTDSRLAFRRLVTCCFLWTKDRLSILTGVPVGSSGPDRAWSCWTRDSARLSRRQRCRRACMLLSSIRRD